MNVLAIAQQVVNSSTLDGETALKFQILSTVARRTDANLNYRQPKAHCDAGSRSHVERSLASVGTWVTSCGD